MDFETQREKPQNARKGFLKANRKSVRKQVASPPGSQVAEELSAESGFVQSSSYTLRPHSGTGMDFFLQSRSRWKIT